MNIAVLGAGAWGTALACHAAQRHSVRLWARDAALVQAICSARSNERYLPGVSLPPTLEATAVLTHAVAAAELIVIATPMSGLRPMVQALAAQAVSGEGGQALAPLIWLCKGLEADTGLLPHQVVEQAWPGIKAGALSGPSFAQEVAAGLPVALTVAASDDRVGQGCVEAFHHHAARIYRSTDVVGVEVGGALKNIMAIATGLSDGMKLGLNARAALLTRGLAEIVRYGTALGARPETFMGLAGVGDLVLTCTGDLSRNRTVGLRLAGGESLGQIVASLGHVAEGVACCRAVRDSARQLGVEMPITDAVGSVLFDSVGPREALVALLAREPREEYRGMPPETEA